MNKQTNKLLTNNINKWNLNKKNQAMIMDDNKPGIFNGMNYINPFKNHFKLLNY